VKENTAAELADALLAESRKRILESGGTDDEQALKIIEDTVFEGGESLDLKEIERLIRRIFARTRRRTGILDIYTSMDAVNEIMINGRDNIFIEDRNGIRRIDDSFDTTEELEDVIRNIASSVHREINEMNPILDARLPDGSRVNAVYKNIALNGPILTIRKFSSDRLTIGEMIKLGTLTSECADFLKIVIESGYNIFISGGTSSGKTTFLNSLASFIPSTERLIVIEDSSELQIRNTPNLVQMECHNANTMGLGEITMDMLIRTSLRMRPDRIIVGEVRGGEVADMLQAMNTGHSSLSTGHGNSVRGMLRRLEAMYLMAASMPMDAIRSQIVEGIDIMIHLGRMPDGSRRVMEIQELLEFKDGNYLLNPLFSMNEDMELIPSGNRIVRRNRMIWKGINDDRL
jgi:Flp pilus assembly protein, ATPase CpaF